MGLFGKAVLAIAFVSVVVSYTYNSLTKIPEMPKLDSQWWGPGAPGKDDPAIKPFKINVPEERLVDLKKRLTAATFQKPLEDSAFTYGFNTDYFKKVNKNIISNALIIYLPTVPLGRSDPRFRQTQTL